MSRLTIRIHEPPDHWRAFRMCGRINQSTNPHLFADLFSVLRGFNDDWTPRYNICPTQPVLCIRDSDQREFFTPKWGLIPSWAKDVKIGAQCINARVETADTKPAFRSAFKKRRCLVIANGYYEWRMSDKWPFFISLCSGEPMAFAGLWETWKSPDGPIESCTICTTEANDMIGQIHYRMPVILPRAIIDHWLDQAVTDPEELKPILLPYPADAMQAFPVGKAVGNVKNEGPQLMKPIDGPI